MITKSICVLVRLDESSLNIGSVNYAYVATYTIDYLQQILHIMPICHISCGYIKFITSSLSPFR